MVLRLETPLPLHDLTAPLDMEHASRQKARYPAPWSPPLIVLLTPPVADLSPTFRAFDVTLANAGATAWGVKAIEEWPDWLELPAIPLPWEIPPGGIPCTWSFPIRADRVPVAGSQRLVLAGVGGPLTFTFSLTVPDAAVPWPVSDRIDLANPFMPGAVAKANLTVRNLGPQPLTGRAEGVPRGLLVTPDWIDLPPGEEVDLLVQAQPDPDLLVGAQAAVVLTSADGVPLCRIPAEVAPMRDEPLPVLMTQAELDLGAHAPGRSVTGRWLVQNRGSAAGILRPVLPPGVSGPEAVPLPAGSKARLDLTFDMAAFPDGLAEVAVTTGCRLPGLEALQLRARFQAVTLSVDPPTLDFGTIPFGQTVYRTLEICRSDGRVPRISFEIPDDLAGQISARSGRVSFYNDKRAPESVSGRTIVLQDTTLHVSIPVPIVAQCQTPHLTAEPLRRTLVPGAVVTERLPLKSTGGRVSVTRATVRPTGLNWLRIAIVDQGEHIDARIATRRGDRGRLQAQVELRTNIPRSEPVTVEIDLELKPTWRMLAGDGVARLWERICALARRLGLVRTPAVRPKTKQRRKRA